MNLRRFLLVLALPLSGCAPLTFSEDAALDFERYSVVSVAVVSNASSPAAATAYLAEQLREISGFEAVVTDALAVADLYLDVTVTVSPTFDDEGNIEFDAVAEYEAYTGDPPLLVDSGAEDDTSNSDLEAQQDVLDEVALHYIAPFRL